MSIPGDTSGLGSLEAKVMQVAWADPQTHLQVRDVLERIDDELAYTTVMTVMARLHDKGLLRRRRQGRAWAYRAASSQDAYTAGAMVDVLAGAGNRTAALLHFVADLEPGEAEELRRLLGDGAAEDRL